MFNHVLHMFYIYFMTYFYYLTTGNHGWWVHWSIGAMDVIPEGEESIGPAAIRRRFACGWGHWDTRVSPADIVELGRVQWIRFFGEIYNHWIGLRENLQETSIFSGKNHGFL